MDTMINDFAALNVHKSREQELMAIAEKERNAKAMRDLAARRIRRVIRINNDSAR